MNKQFKKGKGYKLFKEKILEEVPQIAGFFKKKGVLEKRIKKVWKENIKQSKVPVVISLDKYTYGIGGVMGSQNFILTDKEILQRFLYTSIIEEGIFRDLFYLIKFAKKLEKKNWILNFICKNYIEKNKEMKKEYDSRIHDLGNDEDHKIALAIQVLYSKLNENEIEKFHDELIKEVNERIIKNIEEWLKVFPEWYDAFYFGYKKDGKKYLKCYAITKYGIIKDISFGGEKMIDPVKLLAENIEKYMDEESTFKLELEKKLEKYPEDIKMIDKIYEYIMEIPDLAEGELKELFMRSVLLERIFREVVSEGERIINLVIHKEGENWKEIIYYLLLLALGFELPAIKINYESLDVKKLIEKNEIYEKELSGAMTSEEEREKIKTHLKEIFDNFEYFLSYFVPFVISKEECKGRTEELKNEEYRKNIRQKIFSKKVKEQPLGLGDLIEILKEAVFIKNNKEIKKKLEKIKEERNEFTHSFLKGEAKWDRKIFKGICDTLNEIYKYIEKNFPFFILKVKQLVDDSNARKYIVGEELNNKKKWYITFEDEEIYDEIDSTYFYYVSSSTNPVARNPFMFPLIPDFIKFLRK